MTTPSAANSSVPSMPSNAAAESAALPAGPVTWVARPSGASAAVVRMSSTTSAASSQPSGPRSIGTMVCSASRSSDGNGPCTSPAMPCTPAKASASAVAACWSSVVRPPSRW